MSRPLRLVLLDRDGTINEKAPEGEYVERPEELVLLPGAAAAIARLNHARIPVVVVTNQRGIALGRMSLEDLDRVHGRLDELLVAQGARIDAYYACPHREGECDCRKPRPGLLRRAAEDRGLGDPARGVIIGDSDSDVAAGRAAGMATVRLGGGPEADAPSLAVAVEGLLGRTSVRPGASPGPLCS